MTLSSHKRHIQSVVLEAVRTPRTVAADYLLRLGLNFRAGNPLLEDGTWHIPLRALIPASPGVVPRRNDQLYYRFEDFGEILLDSNLKRLSVPKLGDLDDRFQAERSRLFAKIEKMILDFGVDKWGRIPGIRFFLNPLNAIVSEALSLPNIAQAKLEHQDYLYYADLLKSIDLLEESPNNPGHLQRTNELVTLAERNRKEKGDDFYIDETAIEVTSIICSKFYDLIQERVKLFPSYVDTTVAYYVKAVRLKKLVPMTVSELEYSYNVLGRRPQDEKAPFYGKVADLVTAGFLQWHSQGVVIGVNPIYEKVEGVAPEIESNVYVLKPNA